jgi:tetratricopeptide (TPR) repeat protein
MGDKTNKITIIAARSGIVTEAKSVRKSHLGWRLFTLIVGAVALVAIIVVVILFENRDRAHEVATNKQQQLQTAIGNVDAVGNLTKLLGDSDALIKGQSNGTYSLSDKQLAQAYANRGDVEFNRGDEKSAIADYEQAVKLDGAQQLLVGNNEFVARYHLGERKELISLLQILQKPYKDNYATGMQEHYEQYQSYIDDLQAGKDLDI